MYADVILKAFEKVKSERKLDTPWNCAQHLSDIVLDNKGGSYSAKSLHNKWKEAHSDLPEKLVVRRQAVDALCRFLGAKDYIDFLAKNPGLKSSQPIVEERNSRIRKIIWVTLISLGLILAYGFYHYSQPRFMVWQEDHYEEVNLDLKIYSLKELKVFKEDRIDNFRKVQPDCAYPFFDNNGMELLWYGKNKAGDLEYFTDIGLHPETGKTLKKITPYMIKKYICPTYPN